MAVLLACIAPVSAQPGPGGRNNACSDTVVPFETATATTNCQAQPAGQTYAYPSDFSYVNKVAVLECPQSNTRIIISNGVPDHEVTQGNPNAGCEVPWWVQMPLTGTKAAQPSEPMTLGIIAMATNGVPVYGAQEGGGTNAVEPDATARITDAQHWWGHAALAGDWHYHAGELGKAEHADAQTIIAYALDGFPIKGPLADKSKLDACNGYDDGSGYAYHVLTDADVDAAQPYCNGTSAAVQWNYVLGCHSGDLSSTVVGTCTDSTRSIPEDCKIANSSNEGEVFKLCGLAAPGTSGATQRLPFLGWATVVAAAGLGWLLVLPW